MAVPLWLGVAAILLVWLWLADELALGVTGALRLPVTLDEPEGDAVRLGDTDGVGEPLRDTVWLGDVLPLRVPTPLAVALPLREPVIDPVLLALGVEVADGVIVKVDVPLLDGVLEPLGELVEDIVPAGLGVSVSERD